MRPSPKAPRFVSARSEDLQAYAIIDGKKVYDDSQIIDNPDTVEGIVLLQKGDDSDPVLDGIHAEVNGLTATRITPAFCPKA